MVNFVHYFGCKGSNYFLITKQKAEKILFFLLLIDLYSVLVDLESFSDIVSTGVSASF